MPPRGEDLRHKGTRPLPSESQDVIVGRIRGPWGLRGDLKVEVLTDFDQRFAPGSVLYLRDQPVRVEAARKIKGGLRVKLDTVNDRNSSESLRGQYLTVPQTEVYSLPEGSYFHFQIMDLEVWTEQGEHLGTVKEIISTGANDVYVIGREERTDLLLPALSGVVLKVDIEGHCMTVRLPEGLQ